MPNGGEARRCQAKSPRTGERCHAWAMKGQRVCGAHGGRAPQNKRKAEERMEEARQELLEALMPALKQIRTLSLSAESESVKLSAAKDLVDRTGLTAKQIIEVTHHDGDSELDREIGGLLERMDALEETSESESVDE